MGTANGRTDKDSMICFFLLIFLFDANSFVFYLKKCGVVGKENVVEKVEWTMWEGKRCIKGVNQSQ